MRILFFFLCSCISLFGNFDDPNVLATTEGDPSSNPCPYVNSLTGEFIGTEVDLIVDAIEPIVVQRYFTHTIGLWEFFPHIHLQLLDGCGIKKKYIQAREPNGTTVMYRFLDEDHHVYKFSIQKHGKGVANTAHGVLSGRTNLKNHTVYRDHKGKIITMHCANGTIRTYQKTDKRTYLLEHEQLSSGRWIIYTYEDGKLESVRTMNPSKTQEYARITFVKNGKNLTIKASDGRKVYYQEGKTNFSKISAPERAEEDLGYEASMQFGILRTFITEKTFAGQKTVRVGYYSPQKNGAVQNFEDPLCNRVEWIYETIGDEVIPAYRFVYDISREKVKDKYIYTDNGRTDVFDIENNKTSIHFTPDFYVSVIERFKNELGRQKLHSKMIYTWKDHGQLESKTFCDAEEVLIWEKKFDYDEHGNVLKETFSGDLQGEGTKDSYSVRYSYDNQNRVQSKQEDNGKITLYDYLYDTDLLTARFLGDGKKIYQRELRLYDENHLLIALIVDDGSNADPHNLEDVTERHITRFINNTRGLPKWTEEYYLKNGQEKALAQNPSCLQKKGKHWLQNRAERGLR